MALISAVDLRALHNTSKQFSNCIKDGSKTTANLYGLWESPRYATASSKELEPAIPSPDIFDFLATHKKKDLLPSITSCAVHLEFLAALHELRYRVLESEELDKVFDIKVLKKTVLRKGENVELKDDTLMERRQVKWEKYVDCAVARFEGWWKTVLDTISPCKADSSRSDIVLPPLDVLMVWHSFMLNPRWFRTSCSDGLMKLYEVEFPWQAIHEALTSDDWSFSLPQTAAASFETNTSLEPDLFKCILGWQSYPAEVSKDLLRSMRRALPQVQLDALKTKIKKPDERLLQCFVDKNEGVGEDMKNAVLRQVSFVDKMWEHLWIRSPVVEGTIRRARDRYSNFLWLFKTYPTTMFVPTLDIDLVWHTHQCSPSVYYTTTRDLAGKFLVHNDSIVQTKLDTGLQDTKSLYRMRFGKEYHTCSCWDCEALRSAAEGAGKHADWENIAKQVAGDVTYYRAVEVARRKKEAIPVR